MMMKTFFNFVAQSGRISCCDTHNGKMPVTIDVEKTTIQLFNSFYRCYLPPEFCDITNNRPWDGYYDYGMGVKVKEETTHPYFFVQPYTSGIGHLTIVHPENARFVFDNL
ncbi:hypothetical protein [Crocosphaera sp. XPORK-15E]|uniref:hypothetical protein n=1 Tax=Crocosphaera sp. XPORK-15E TaxID=3110247 RepID=UPI002B200C42|nr:hypothetical protein [Crocosphaera sp. XPORK-15E]MEA5536798.1 hypothetical protein [Crocosphaera sp. XPORK-15E]